MARRRSSPIATLLLLGMLAYAWPVLLLLLGALCVFFAIKWYVRSTPDHSIAYFPQSVPTSYWQPIPTASDRHEKGNGTRALTLVSASICGTIALAAIDAGGVVLARHLAPSFSDSSYVILAQALPSAKGLTPFAKEMLALLPIIVALFGGFLILQLLWVLVRKKSQQVKSQNLIREAKNRASTLMGEGEERARMIEEAAQQRVQVKEHELRLLEEALVQRSLTLTDIDSMSGVRFEHYIAQLFTRDGYAIEHKGQSGDLGADLIAARNGQTFVVQCKRQEQPLSRRAVSDAVAARIHYDCSGAMVVTNNWFTRDAHKLAQTTKCRLIDRDGLADMVFRLHLAGQKPAVAFEMPTSTSPLSGI